MEKTEDARRELHEKLAQLAKDEVDAAIDASVNDSGGMIKGWQIPHVGSFGGYAAIRAMGSKEGASTGRNSPGAITNYLENGHRIRPATKPTKRKLKVAYVNGRHFYQRATAALEAKALALAQKFADELAERLRGD